MYTISDQDDSGAWMRKEFPQLFYIVSPGGYGARDLDRHPLRGRGTRTTIRSTRPSAIVAGRRTSSRVTARSARHIRTWPMGWKATPRHFSSLIPNGLNVPGTSGLGRLGRSLRALSTRRCEDLDPKAFTGGVPVNRGDAAHLDQRGRSSDAGRRRCLRHGRREPGREDLSPAIARRSGAGVTNSRTISRRAWTGPRRPYAQANHPPVAKLSHPDAFTVKSGQGFGLDARPSTDPDGDSLSYLWYRLPGGRHFQGRLSRSGRGKFRMASGFNAPKVESEQTLHFILKVTDKGSPP